MIDHGRVKMLTGVDTVKVLFKQLSFVISLSYTDDSVFQQTSWSSDSYHVSVLLQCPVSLHCKGYVTVALSWEWTPHSHYSLYFH